MRESLVDELREKNFGGISNGGGIGEFSKFKYDGDIQEVGPNDSGTKQQGEKYDLGENGSVEVKKYGPELFPGNENGIHYIYPTLLPIEIMYYPGGNIDPFNFVQTVHSNFPHEIALLMVERKMKMKDIKLQESWVVDGRTQEGTYYSSEELRLSQKYTDNKGGIYYQFDDTPGRTFVKGKTVYWEAELSIVERVDNRNVNLITFSWGFTLNKRGNVTVNPLTKTGRISTQHQTNVQNAVVK